MKHTSLNPINSASSAKGVNNRKERFFDCMPKVFSRKDFVAIAMRVGIPDRSEERYIMEFSKCGMMHCDEWGKYSKVISPDL